MLASIAAIVLAGGGSARLGGADKCWLQVGGRPILESVVAAVAALGSEAEVPARFRETPPDESCGSSPVSVGPIVVVGPRHELITPVHWTREEPPGAGPVAGLQAGLACLDAARLDAAGRADRADRVATPKLVLILGGDMPFVGLGLAELLAAATETQAPRPDAVIGQDTGGRDQYLLAVWRTTALRAALSSAAPNASLRSLYRGVAVLRRTLPDAATLDCDTPQELERARALWPIQPELG